MNRVITALTIGLFLLSACSHYKGKENKKLESEAQAAQVTPVTQDGIATIIQSWPETSKAAVNAMNAKYGMPAIVSDEMIVWNNTAPFKRTIVYREEVTHLFPLKHADVLQQVVDYRVPLDKVVALSKFDGSLVIDRTRGELSSRNEKEEMNILALNLADQIIREEKTVEEARREYSKNAEAFAAGTNTPLITSLNFTLSGDTTDPDVMMESQSEEQPRVRPTREAKKVQEVIEEEKEEE